MATPLQDDPTILDGAILWRRIPTWHFVYDANLQRWRPSSAAFDNDPDGGPTSVILADEVLAAGGDAASVLVGHTGFALAAVKAGDARACGQGIARDPLPEQRAHALLFGAKPKSVQRRLAKAAMWAVEPQQTPP